jgi:hypothetical protein
MAGLAIPLIGAGISGLAGLFGNRSQTTKQTSSSTTDSNQNLNASTNYSLNPFQQQLAEMFTQGASNLYNQSANLAPYTSGGLQQIAGQGAANNKMISNIMAQRGLSFSPMAATGLVHKCNEHRKSNEFIPAGYPAFAEKFADAGPGFAYVSFQSDAFRCFANWHPEQSPIAERHSRSYRSRKYDGWFAFRFGKFTICSKCNWSRRN